MFGAETWVLSKADELRLGVYERKILRRIYGPICEGAAWRARYNEELYRLYDETGLVTTVRITRLKWAEHIVRMQDNLPCKKSPWTSRRAEGKWEGQTLDGWMEWWGMQRGWESEIGRARPRREMVGGDFLNWPRPCMGCSAWEWVSKWVIFLCFVLSVDASERVITIVSAAIQRALTNIQVFTLVLLCQLL